MTFHPKQIPSGIGNYLAGFTDGDGCFSVSIVPRVSSILTPKSKKEWKVTLSFAIGQKEKKILSTFKKHLNCGTLSKTKRKGIYFYQVTNRKQIQTSVIPFFNRFGFLSEKKIQDFSSFQQITKLVGDNTYFTSDSEELTEIVILRSVMNPGNARTRQYSDEEILGVDSVDYGKPRPLLPHQIPSDFEQYLAGFTDAEGSLNTSVQPRKDFNTGVKVSMCFNLSQKDRVILEKFQKYLNCGRIRERKKDGLYLYEVNGFKEIQAKVIPFFKRVVFLSEKKIQDFSIFQQIAEVMENGDHLRREGVVQILYLRNQMNFGGKHKYTDEYFLKILRYSEEAIENILRDFRLKVFSIESLPDDYYDYDEEN